MTIQFIDGLTLNKIAIRILNESSKIPAILEVIEDLIRKCDRGLN